MLENNRSHDNWSYCNSDHGSNNILGNNRSYDNSDFDSNDMLEKNYKAQKIFSLLKTHNHFQLVQEPPS